MYNLLRKDELSKLLGVSHCTLWRWTKSGHLPKPIKLGQNTIAWAEADIEAWIKTRRNG